VPRSAERLVFGALLAFLLAVVVLIAIIGSLLQHQRQCGEGGLLGGPPTAAAEAIPAELMPIFEAAEQRYGVAWSVLAAINKVETDFGRNVCVSSTGAIGWMQFMPATWRRYGVDGDGDGRKDPYNPRDAIPAAASYLRASGAQRDLRGAILTCGQIVIAAEISVSSPDFGLLGPVMDAALSELADIGVTDTPGVLVADTGYWHQVQMEQIVEHGIQVPIPPDADNRKSPRPGWTEASTRSCVAYCTPSSAAICTANARA
jgi:hypothetical protein